MKSKGPFEDLLVIDLTHVLNGPFGTQMLCDLGARVIKIETPGHGDDTRTYGPYVNGQSLYYSFVNRGKESIVLNLKDNDDRAIFINMIKQADIVAENFRPGTMDKLGFSYEELSTINPRLIYASSSGFGHTGPLKDFPAYDTIIQAMSGIMMETGFHNGPPVRVGTSISDLCAGIYMFCGIVSALYAREKTGKGAHVDIAMFDSTISFLEHGLMAYVATGKAPERIGNRHPYMSPFDVFNTKDKPITICCGNDSLFSKLCQSIELPSLIKDPRFLTNIDRVKNQEQLKKLIENKLKEHNADYWINAIDVAGVPAAPLLSVAEAMQLPQTQARNMLIEAGGIKMPGNPIKISSYPDPKERKGAPELNEHGEILRKEFS
ncbi:Formyl-coenzyme A transferase [Providencia rustigianii]|uniref:Formyl-coenzyme A transferase n=1 Tax=Providencia rustigianii TaxID=158850 RepID=A0A379G0Z8_9GAMM|nr:MULTISPECIES: CoA:oxalate CoA-transferase [Providencia]MTC57933.1 CoA:oxalate CoA-transferase [Providencia rustigianii]SPY76652.1 Formyl-coenzyme A transferase [Providencia rustigianii]SUC34607.1 Formyl-coenzyme A transferase [Providencia rustigianii]VEB64046.1 Formyl-coenzyme A transferase [Providencia rustigianii]